MRVCIIGDSHIGAPKLAIDQGRFSSQRLSVSFWGATGDKIKALDTDGRRVFWNELLGDRPVFASPPRADLPFDAFDVFVFYGGRFRFETILDVYRKNEWRRQYYTPAFLRDGIASYILNYHIVRTAVRVAEASGRTTIVAPCPLRSGRTVWPWPRVPRATARGAWHLVADILDDLGVRALPQPVWTTARNYYTRPRYGIGSQRLMSGNEHGEGDTRHMNPEYGALFLGNLERLLFEGSVDDPFPSLFSRLRAGVGSGGALRRTGRQPIRNEGLAGDGLLERPPGDRAL